MRQALFIPLGFYDYDIQIVEEIKKNGFEVDTFNPIGTYTFWEKVRNTIEKGRFLKEKAKKMQASYFMANEKNYDLILVIVGRHLEPNIFREFCMKNEGARKVLYLWDDVKRVENFNEIEGCFDDIFSFDQIDVREYGFQMLPLFFTDYHRYRGEEKKYRFGLMGMLHSERLSLFDQVARAHNLREEDCFVYLLGAKFRHFLTWFLPMRKRWTGRKYIHVNGMPFKSCADILKQTKVALDVQFGSQNGLTLRTLEALAANTKLITTNQNVMQYDFYNPNNICVIKRDAPNVPEGFFEKEYELVSTDIVERYSLSNWVKIILKEEPGSGVKDESKNI